jgi:membrane fusion protein (multidrug efflux system)
MNIYSSLTLILIYVLNVACTANSESNKAETKQTIPVIKLTKESTTITKEYVGNIHAIKNVEIYARVKGYLEQVYVDEGQYVKKDQLLFRINDEEYRSSLSKAKANLSHSIAEAKEMELELERKQQLVDKQIISKTELDVAIARLDAAKAKILEAKSAVEHSILQLNHTRIYAPFSGIIDGIPYKLGSLIDEGTKLTNLSDINEVHVYFNVSETEYLNYVKTSNRKHGDEVELILADGSEFSQQGKVETMEGQFNETTGSIAFRARFQNPEKMLKHGSTGTIRLSSEINSAIIVPHKACFEIQDKTFVFVVEKDHTIKMKSFIPKHRISESYIVESGLNPGDEVVFEGVQSIKEGMKIKPKYIEAPATAMQSSIDKE